MVSSDWPSMSIKPGATTMPWASIVRLRCVSPRFPMAAIFPARIPTSPEYQGEPVPSMMWPLTMTTSNDGVAACAPTRRTPASNTMAVSNCFLIALKVLVLTLFHPHFLLHFHFGGESRQALGGRGELPSADGTPALRSSLPQYRKSREL